MRNLCNISRFDFDYSNSSLPLSSTTWESPNALLCTFGPSLTSATIELYRIKYEDTKYGERQIITSWDAPCPSPDLECDQIMNLRYFIDTNTCCVILSGGDIILIRENPLPGQEALEIVGSIDDGIASASWSPDESFLAICTKTSSFLLMTREFDVIKDFKFTSDDIKATNHVSVGWGKAETQFKGKRAKSLRDPTVPEKVDQGLLSLKEDKGAAISWRGDGEYVAINALDLDNRRMIRVFTKEGVLDSVSEPVDYLETTISWRPAGNLMACVKRHEDKVEIVFFERNGLRHGSFFLRINPNESTWNSTIQLNWNADSSALAVSFDGRVEIWTMGNYHYYLKQTIYLTETLSSEKGETHLLWNPEDPLLFTLYNQQNAVISELYFTVSKSSTLLPNDSGTVAVIDGKSVKITPLKYANIPPPMSLFDIEVCESITDVHVNSKLSIITILTQNLVELFSFTIKKGGIFTYTLLRKIEIAKSCGYTRQVVLSNDKNLYILGDLQDQSGIIFTLSIEDQQDDVSSENQMEASNISNIGLNVEENVFYMVDTFGVISFHDLNKGISSSTSQTYRIPENCIWIEVIYLEEGFTPFGLTSTGSLYAKDQLVARNCTSFIVTSAHLIFTTSNHLLKFVHLNSNDVFEVPADEPESDERCRSIERGAKLVTAMPSSYSLVLQLPRGNLETIYPRAMVLAGIRKSLDELDYKTAFLACRSQRVDMNILHDYKPSIFMKNVETFIDQIKKVEYIDLFLSQLKNEDVTQTMYKDTIRHSNVKVLQDSSSLDSDQEKSKVNKICEAFLKALENRSKTNLQNTITAYVCKSPPDLDGGLSIIAILYKKDQDIAENAAEHICFLADTNQLYDSALGIYDLDVALLIAQQSQKDPREYLPYMQSLQEMDFDRRKFTIDNDLKRYEKALSHLYTIGDFDELIKYTQTHELFESALGLYKFQNDRLDIVIKVYADYLHNKRSFKEAGIAYEYLEDFSAAYASYRQGNLWQEALYSAQLASWKSEKIKHIAQELVENLEVSKQHKSAATIYLDYLDDIESGIAELCRAYQFSEAIRIAALKRKPELIKAAIDPGLSEAFGHTTELLADCKAQLNAQVPRLRDLRLKKEQEPLAFYAGDRTTTTSSSHAHNGTDIPDDVSLASTSASTSGRTFMTRYTAVSAGSASSAATHTTRRTSKARRREERKRARGKKGSVYEEEYLVASIGRLIERVNALNGGGSSSGDGGGSGGGSSGDGSGDMVRGLVAGLAKRGMWEQARVVQDAMAEVVGMCRAVVDEVFEVGKERSVGGDSAGVNGNGGANGEGAVLTGGDAVLQDALESLQQPKVPPVIRQFERMSLTGR